MDYKITEDAYNKVDAVAGQLGLICGFLTAKDDVLALINSTDLYNFMDAQREALEGVIKGIDSLYKAAREESMNEKAAAPAVANAISPAMLLDLIQAVNGVDIGQEKMLAISDGLTESISLSGDTAYGGVVRAYFSALQNAGWDIVSTMRNGCGTMEFQRATATQ